MSRPWRLTRQAEASLIEIARWTHETFGPRQAAACEADLVARCAAIAADTALSQDCRRLIDPKRARPRPRAVGLDRRSEARVKLKLDIDPDIVAMMAAEIAAGEKASCRSGSTATATPGERSKACRG